MSDERDRDIINRDLVILSNYPTLKEAEEYGLVLIATGHPCLIRIDTGEFQLLVEPEIQHRARAEMDAYEEEQLTWNVETNVPDSLGNPGMFPTLLGATFLAAAFLYQQTDRDVITRKGSLNSEGLVLQGEWWRAATSLCLHSDLLHLISNLCAGSLFTVLVNRSFGVLNSFLLIALSGVLGNLLRVWLAWPGLTNSIGASTAVFGALGILVGEGLRLGLKPSLAAAKYGFAPLFGGLMLLSLTGAGDAQTDVLAHVSGFVVGIALGYPARYLAER